MKCACGESGNGITYCERHAIEQKRRTKIIASDLAMAGEAMREELRRRAGKEVAALEANWLGALRKAKEAVDG
jgi:hypothetical protein